MICSSHPLWGAIGLSFPPLSPPSPRHRRSVHDVYCGIGVVNPLTKAWIVGCTITRCKAAGVWTSAASVLVEDCKIFGIGGEGVDVFTSNTRLVGNEIWDSKIGIAVSSGSESTLIENVIRDHSAYGLQVGYGWVMEGAGNVFERNAGGDLCLARR